jgi:hypothetical protein
MLNFELLAKVKAREHGLNFERGLSCVTKIFVSISKLSTILKSPKKNVPHFLIIPIMNAFSSGLGDIKRASAYHRKKCAQMRYGNTTLSHLEVKKYNGKKYTQVMHMLSSVQK